MGANIGGLQGVIRSIVERSQSPEAQARLKRQRGIGLAEMERVRQRIGPRGSFLGSQLGGREGRGGGLFGGAASTAAQQTFGG